VLGSTVTVCVHWASSPEDAAPSSAYVPLCTGAVVVLSRVEQVHPERVPVSNPELLSRFGAEAAFALVRLDAIAAYPTTSTAAVASAVLRFMPLRPGSRRATWKRSGMTGLLKGVGVVGRHPRQAVSTTDVWGSIRRDPTRVGLRGSPSSGSAQPLNCVMIFVKS
jgi:hypothetical protein